MTTPIENKALGELVARCKKLIVPYLTPRNPSPTHGCWITEIEVAGVRIVLEVPVDPEKAAMFDICDGTTMIYRELYLIPRPGDVEGALSNLQKHMVLDDLADV